MIAQNCVSKSGMAQLLSSLNERIRDLDDNVQRIWRIISLEGRIPDSVAQNTLTHFQRVFLDLLGNGLPASFPKDYTSQPGFTSLILGCKAYGRLILEKSDLPAEAESGRFGPKDVLFGYLSVPSDAIAKAEEQAASRLAAERPTHDQAISYMHSKGADGCREIVEFVAHVHKCMAPVIYFVGDRTYSNFYGAGKDSGTNDYDITRVFNELLEKDITKWDSAEVQLVYCLLLLLKSGPHTRIEEFNSQQLNAATLGVYLDRQWSLYLTNASGINKEAANADYAELALHQKAEELRSLREKIEKDYTFFREVNGLNLYKSEHLTPSNEIGVGLRLSVVPEDVRSYVKNTFGLSILGFPSAREYIQAAVFRAFEGRVKNKEPGAFSPVEELVHQIVASALSHTKSEFGMSRCLRRFHEIIDVQRKNDIALACSWPQTNYFCYVVPTEAVVAESDITTLLKILNAISARMRFNSWHYFPGNYPQAAIPKERDYYIPPKMSDTAVWSDQHHPGHIHASVRYSIRSPGSLTIEGKPFHAFFDLRLMRRSGDPYTQDDLADARVYTQLLQHLYQAVMDWIASTGVEYDFEFGTKAWYKKYYGGGDATQFGANIYA